MVLKIRYLAVLLLLLATITHDSMAQGNIDSFLNTLHNKDARSILELVAHKTKFDSGSVYVSVVERSLTSIEIPKVRKAYPKYVMVEKLVKLLDDPERDSYADLLLYNLTLVPALNIIGCDTREKWLTIETGSTITYKDADREFWIRYLVGLSPSDEY